MTLLYVVITLLRNIEQPRYAALESINEKLVVIWQFSYWKFGTNCENIIKPELRNVNANRYFDKEKPLYIYLTTKGQILQTRVDSLSIIV